MVEYESDKRVIWKEIMLLWGEKTAENLYLSKTQSYLEGLAHF